MTRKTDRGQPMGAASLPVGGIAAFDLGGKFLVGDLGRDKGARFILVHGRDTGVSVFYRPQCAQMRPDRRQEPPVLLFQFVFLERRPQGEDKFKVIR